MVQYPITVPRKIYRGSKPNLQMKAQERSRVAQQLEDYINRKVRESDREILQLFYGSIAHDLSLSVDLVRDILFGVDCGHNGMTIFKAATSATQQEQR